MQAPWIIRWIAAVLYGIPGPTEAWAKIIDDLAWPAVTLILVFRFRRYLKIFLNTLADRLPHDHIKFGPFEMTQRSQVLTLDPGGVEDDTLPHTSDDIDRIEALFEFSADKDGIVKLREWVNDHVGKEVSIIDFLTASGHAMQRKEAFDELVKG